MSAPPGSQYLLCQPVSADQILGQPKQEPTFGYRIPGWRGKQPHKVDWKATNKGHKLGNEFVRSWKATNKGHKLGNEFPPPAASPSPRARTAGGSRRIRSRRSKSRRSSRNKSRRSRR